MQKITQTTCFKAYNTNLYVDADGWARLCCKQSYDARFKLGTDEDRWKYIDDMRSYMEAWKWHPSCIVCKQVEEYGNKSVRQLFNEQFHRKNQKPITERESVKFLEINFSNLCNLSCRMCWSKSSTWRIPLDKHLWKEHIELTSLDEESLSYLHNYENVKELEQVQIFWWEPLMEKKHFRFLAFLIKHNLARNIFLWYNSNLTIIPKFSLKEQEEYGWAKDIFDLWKHFSHVELKVSIDGYWKVDEYIRLWSKWDEVLANIDKIQNQWLNNFSLSTRCAIQIDNILTYPEFLLCMISKNIPYAFSSHGFVMWPESLCIQNLPKEIKKYIHKKYEKFFQKYPIVRQKYWEYVKQILNFMDAKEMNERAFQNYLISTKKIDAFCKVEDLNTVIGLYNKLCGK